MLAQERDDRARVLDVPRHAQRQRLDALQDLERGHRRHARAEVAHAFAPRAQQERAPSSIPRRTPCRGSRRTARSASGTCSRTPSAFQSKRARIDQQAADDDAVARTGTSSPSGTTRSAPCSNGRISHGVVNVESTSSGRPCSCASAATRGMSSTSRPGLPSVSPNSSRVLRPDRARASASRSRGSTNVVSMPKRGSV